MINPKKFIFEIPPEAPVFTPNEDEFTDPLEYISRIKTVAEKTGICKIIPPKTWQPPFSIDANTFKFIPRVQRLNELEACTRVKLNFLEDLSKFWELQGVKLKIPTVEKKHLDFYQLHRIVSNNGGYQEVWKNRKWSSISKLLNYKESSTAKILNSHYEKILYPYDVFKAGATVPPIASFSNRTLYEKTKTGKRQIDNLKKSGSTESNRKYTKYDSKKIESITCLICNRGDDEAFILLCDGCDDSYHTYCLYPPIRDIPKGSWHCAKCIGEICKSPTEAYGFDQSPIEYTLSEFGEMADRFKADYFKKLPHMVSYEEVEQEFWKILSRSDELVVVKYGADLHTIDVGSGFPSKNSYQNEYAKSKWNLNNLPNDKYSVLSQLNVQISGMKIPWAYVGMVFSCFCWHVEDHWSYSINYLHWGEPKTWYGVSGEYADKFEQIMRQNAPELFEKSPDLLHHLVTIMNPNILMRNGVPITKVNQRAGEFVITFPRAYHAGFNQGYNFAEAVNFCPSDWLPVGRAAIEHYKEVKRYSVFSHDELTCKLASDGELDVNTARILHKELCLLIDFEKKYRKLLHEKGIVNVLRKNFELLPDEERQCHYCKTTCFVSAVSCSCNESIIACISHIDYICQCEKPKYTLKYRYSLDELYSMLQNTKNICDSYENWCENVQSLLRCDKKCELIDLKDLLESANNRGYPRSNEIYKNLKSIINKIEDHLNLTHDLSKFYRILLFDDREAIDLNIYTNMVNQLNQFPCNVKEIHRVSKILTDLMEFETTMNDCINNKILDIETIKKVLDYGVKLKISDKKIMILKVQYEQALWLDKVKSVINCPETLKIDILNNLIKHATDLEDHKLISKTLIDLQELASIASMWDNKAKEKLDSKLAYELNELEKIVNDAKYIPVYMENIKKLNVLVDDVKKWNAEVDSLFSSEKLPHLSKIEKLNEQSISKIKHDSRHSTITQKLSEVHLWKEKMETLFLRQNSPFMLYEVLMPRKNILAYINKNLLLLNKINKKINKKIEIVDDKFDFLNTYDELYLDNYFRHIENKELNMIIELRQLNMERINNYNNFASSNDNEYYKNLFKCCICNRHINNTIKSKRCNLCMDYYHVDCKENETNMSAHSLNSLYRYVLCNNCERSKRPNFECIIDSFNYYKKLQIKLFDGYSLKRLVDRILSWQESIRNLLNSTELNKIVKCLLDIDKLIINLCDNKIDNADVFTNFSNTNELNQFNEAYKSLKEDTKQQLDNLYVSGLLLEFNSKENGPFLLMMNLINKFNSKQNNFIEIQNDFIDKIKRKRIHKPQYSPLKLSYSSNKDKGINTEATDQKTNKQSTDRGNIDQSSQRKINFDSNEDICASNNCIIPIGDNIDWVQCDGNCNRWFHMICVGLKKIGKNEEYICNECEILKN